MYPMLDGSPNTRNGITATYLPWVREGRPGLTMDALLPGVGVPEIMCLIGGIARRIKAARIAAPAGATHFQGITRGCLGACMTMEAITGRLPCQASRSAMISAAFG